MVTADGGGVSILSSHGIRVALYATDDTAATVEELQLRLGEGPCIDAARTGGPVLVTDLADPAEGVAGRWPAFTDEALSAGIRGILALPIRIGAIDLGSMDLYYRRPRTLSSAEMSAVLLTVDAIGARLLDLDGHRADEAASPYDLSVHQAAGMMKVQLATTIEDAMVRLRAAAYAEGVPVNTLAAEVVQGRRRFSKES